MSGNGTKEIYAMNLTPKISSYRVYLSQFGQKNSLKKYKYRNPLPFLKQREFNPGNWMQEWCKS